MNAFTIYALYGAPLLVVAMGYIAMRAFGYGEKPESHPSTPAE